jgi:hypothetical protein
LNHLPWRRVPLSILNLLISLSFCRWAIGGRLNLPSIKKAGSTAMSMLDLKTLFVFRYLRVLWCIVEFTALPAVLSTTINRGIWSLTHYSVAAGVPCRHHRAPPKPRDREFESPLDEVMTLQGVYCEWFYTLSPGLRALSGRTSGNLRLVPDLARRGRRDLSALGTRSEAGRLSPDRAGARFPWRHARRRRSVPGLARMKADARPARSSACTNRSS